MNKHLKYLKVWWLYTTNSFSTALYSRFGASLFFIGKVVRFLLFFVFLLVLVPNSQVLAGYSLYQIVFFYLVFNLLDTLTQLLFREVYRFHWKVIRGDFDLDLVQPINPLFKSLAGGADPLDLLMLIPSVIFLIIVAQKLAFNVSGLVLFLLLFINGFFIAASFHVIVLALGVITSNVDNAIMIYRDISNVGRIPLDIYQEPVRFLFTFILPIGVMMTFPAKAFLGLLSIGGVLISLLIGFILLFGSISFWRFSLTRYASASS